MTPTRARQQGARLSEAMLRALKGLAKRPDCASWFRVPYTTFAALERRGLIRVETTFNSIAFPQKARAEITTAGRSALASPLKGD